MHIRSLYAHKDLGVFAVMGVAGGLLGATFNQMNRVLTVLRLQYITTPKRKLIEVLALALAMALLSFCVPFAGACKPQPPLDASTEVFTYASVLRPFTCADRASYNELASLYFNAWDDALRILFHLPMVRRACVCVHLVMLLLAFVRALISLVRFSRSSD